MILNELFETSETLLTQRNVLSIDVSPYELSNLMKEFRAADPTYNKIGDAAMVTFYTPEERKDFEQFLKSKRVKYNSVGELSESRISVFEATRDELIANVEKRRNQQFVDKVLNFLHSAVSQDPDRQSVGGHAFDVARQIDLGKIGLDAKSLEKLYRERFGITEGYQLQLERDPDADLLVLHVKDTRTGRRSEVRGKPGYESDGYDPDDRLHQLLDRIGKAANVSELINGETVSINPKHPQAKHALTATSGAFNEAFDTEADWVLDMNTKSQQVYATKIDDAYIELTYKLFYPADVYIDFTRGGSIGITGEGSQNKIFGAVINHIKQWVDKNKPSKIFFSAIKPSTGAVGSQDTTRSRLYQKMVQRFASQNGYDFDVVDTGMEDTFMLTRKETSQVNEALNQPYSWKWVEKENYEWAARSKTDNGNLLEVSISQNEPGVWNISFRVDDIADKTGSGDQFRIFATVTEIVNDWVNKVGKDAEIIEFSAYKGANEGPGRTKLYKRLASLLAKQLGFRIKTMPAGRNIDIYQLHNPVYESVIREDANTTNQISDEQKEKILSSLYVNTGIKLPARYTLWRGIGNSGMGMATYGTGLYTTTNRKLASQFGKVVKMDSEALPDYPLRFDTINDYEIWLGQSIKILGYNDARDFVKDYNDIRFFVQGALGYDGIQIGKGRDAMFVQYPI